MMDSLYKRFGNSDPSPSSSQTYRSAVAKQETNDLAKEGDKTAASEVGTVRVRPISAAVFRKNASQKSNKRVAFRPPKPSVSARSSPTAHLPSQRSPASFVRQLLGSFSQA